MPLKQKLLEERTRFPFQLTTLGWHNFSRALEVMSICAGIKMAPSQEKYKQKEISRHIAHEMIN